MTSCCLKSIRKIYSYPFKFNQSVAKFVSDFISYSRCAQCFQPFQNGLYFEVNYQIL